MSTDNQDLYAMLRSFIMRQTEFNEYQRGVNAASQARLNGIQDELTEFKDEANARFEGLANDAAEVKGGHAYVMTTQQPELVAERLGFYYERVMSAGELVDMTREQPEVISTDNERESFLNADLVLKVKDKVNSLTNYVAVEVSYTGQERDAERALRNAGFLNQFTGRPAYAAVASVKNDEAVQSQIDKKGLLWHSIRAADLQPN